MLRNKINKKRAALVAVVTLALAGTAFAYWTAGGSGDGTGSAGNNAGAAVHLTGTLGGSLSPGGTQTLTIKGYNDGTDAATVENVSAGTVTINSPAGCSAGEGQFTADNIDVDTTALPAGGTVGSAVTLGTADVHMGNVGNQDDCKGASITVPLTAP